MKYVTLKRFKQDKQDTIESIGNLLTDLMVTWRDFYLYPFPSESPDSEKSVVQKGRLSIMKKHFNTLSHEIGV